jgi:hypothetical protein
MHECHLEVQKCCIKNFMRNRQKIVIFFILHIHHYSTRSIAYIQVSH